MFQYVVNFFAKNKIQVVLSDTTSYKGIYIGIAIVVLIFFLLLKRIFTTYVLKIVLKYVNKTKFNMDTQIVSAFQKPITNFFGVLGLYFALKVLINAGIPITILNIDRAFSSVIIMLIYWGLYNLTGDSSMLFQKMHKAYDVKVDKILFPFISKILKLLLLALAITIIAEKWGYNIQGFVAGLGLGGLAFALAAKDAAANIIAGICIIVDKPFSIGDWISCDILEGSVETIDFRTTKIRAIDQSLIIVPNSQLTIQGVINFSRRSKRRVSMNLELNYKTPKENLEAFIVDIRSMLETHPQVNMEEILVRLDKFSTSSIDVLICFFADTPDYYEYFKIKEEIDRKSTV